MDIWIRELEKAKTMLRQHNPQKSLQSLEKALSSCPPTKPKDLSRILLYLGVALQRLGQGETALKTWNVGCKVLKTSPSAKMYKRFSNEYGMVKQETLEEDDWQAFLSIHRARYLERRPGGEIKSLPERDMIEDLIRSYYRNLKKSGSIQGKTPAEKISLFRSIRIVFPLPLYLQKEESAPIAVDFRKKRRLSTDTTCWCGSGMPYQRCCGRISRNTGSLSDLF